ncbi:hypothetical protein [Zoogloea sp.]|uniref:hypothetical protein n=1 Tax=Zoogloea sp. TaxID=49181 RepID=UPI001415B011|nr:MAG: hypothetical protein F9K15_00485 [Zoogloea sp.]
MTTPLDAALLDVRKAYRLLADYQQRILELLAFIRTELGAVHYHQHFRNKPPRSLNGLELDNSGGARLLPFNDVSALWLRYNGQDDPANQHQKGDLLIDVWVCSDSGNGVDKKPVLGAEDSRSELRIYFFLCSEDVQENANWYYQVWNGTGYPPFGSVASCDSSPGYRVYGEAIALTDLSDEATTREAIAQLRARASVQLGQTI